MDGSSEALEKGWENSSGVNRRPHWLGDGGNGSLISGKQPVLWFVLEKIQEGLLEAWITHSLRWRGDEAALAALPALPALPQTSVQEAGVRAYG